MVLTWRSQFLFCVDSLICNMGIELGTYLVGFVKITQGDLGALPDMCQIVSNYYMFSEIQHFAIT